MTFSITTLGKPILSAVSAYAECRYAACLDYLNDMLSVIMLNVAMLSVKILIVIMLSVLVPSNVV